MKKDKFYDITNALREEQNKVSPAMEAINAMTAPERAKRLTLKVETITNENERLKRLLHDLTPGGSEFYGNYEYCAKWVRENRLSEKQSLTKIIADLKGENKALKEINAELEKFIKQFETAKNAGMMLALEFGYKQCEKGENIQAAFLNYNKIAYPTPEPETLSTNQP